MIINFLRSVVLYGLSYLFFGNYDTVWFLTTLLLRTLPVICRIFIPRCRS